MARGERECALREQVATPIESSNRAVSEVTSEHGASSPTAHKALVPATAR